MTTAPEAWKALADWQPQRLTDLVSANPRTRLAELVRTVADIRFDFAKTHLDAAATKALTDLAAARGCETSPALFADAMLPRLSPA